MKGVFVMKCQHCNHDLSESDKICQHCGHKNEESAIDKIDQEKTEASSTRLSYRSSPSPARQASNDDQLLHTSHEEQAEDSTGSQVHDSQATITTATAEGSVTQLLGERKVSEKSQVAEADPTVDGEGGIHRKPAISSDSFIPAQKVEMSENSHHQDHEESNDTIPRQPQTASKAYPKAKRLALSDLAIDVERSPQHAQTADEPRPASSKDEREQGPIHSVPPQSYQNQALQHSTKSSEPMGPAPKATANRSSNGCLISLAVAAVVIFILFIIFIFIFSSFLSY